MSPSLHLESYNTDRNRFVTLMMSLKARHPEAYAVMKLQMRVLVGDAHLDQAEQAELVDRFRAALGAHPRAAELASRFEQDLCAEVA